MAKTVPGNLGPYRLLKAVHAGQACVLWQAFDDSKQRMVGLKTLDERHLKDYREIANLRQEYKVSRQVAHPRIIEVYEFDVDRGRPYLAMEWFPWPNLKQRIQQGVEKLAPLTAKIIEQAAEGLSHVNAKGWVHRDIKPENFLVADDGEVKLIDLGLATRARRGILKLLAFQTKVQGTPSYMSPEQIRKQVVDQRADVYSFGCTVFELVTGKPPFLGSSINDLLNKHLKAPPPSLETLDRNITAEFGHLIRRSLAKDPGCRPSSAGQLLREFRTCQLYKIPPRRPDQNAS